MTPVALGVGQCPPDRGSLLMQQSDHFRVDDACHAQDIGTVRCVTSTLALRMIVQATQPTSRVA